jgi:hypothetical protein
MPLILKRTKPQIAHRYPIDIHVACHWKQRSVPERSQATEWRPCTEVEEKDPWPHGAVSETCTGTLAPLEWSLARSQNRNVAQVATRERLTLTLPNSRPACRGLGAYVRFERPRAPSAHPSDGRCRIRTSLKWISFDFLDLAIIFLKIQNHLWNWTES